MKTRFEASDFVCLLAFAVLLVMSVISFYDDTRLDYQFNTGIVCAVFTLIPVLLKHSGIINVPLTLVILAELSIFLHGYGVLLLKYDYLVMWDTVTHTLSSVTVSICVFYALLCIDRFDKETTISYWSMHLFIILITAAFGVYWEVFELFADRIWLLNMQYSPWDTVRDMICDIAGALIIAVYAHFWLKIRDSERFLTELRLHPRVMKIISPSDGTGQDTVREH